MEDPYNFLWLFLMLLWLDVHLKGLWEPISTRVVWNIKLTPLRYTTKLLVNFYNWNSPIFIVKVSFNLIFLNSFACQLEVSDELISIIKRNIDPNELSPERLSELLRLITSWTDVMQKEINFIEDKVLIVQN